MFVVGGSLSVFDLELLDVTEEEQEERLIAIDNTESASKRTRSSSVLNLELLDKTEEVALEHPDGYLALRGRGRKGGLFTSVLMIRLRYRYVRMCVCAWFRAE